MIRTATLICFLAFLFSCNQVLSQTIIKTKKLDSSKHLTPKFDHVSLWLIENEDSLYSEFIAKANAALVANGPRAIESEPVDMSSNDESTYMGRFTEEVTKEDSDSLYVSFYYTKSSNLSQICITALLNKKYALALDTILNPIPNLKHFKIQKYLPADTTIDSLNGILPDINIAVKDLRIKMSTVGSLQNIIVYIHGDSKDKINGQTYIELAGPLFGEEIFLKKINSLQFEFCHSIKPGLLTIQEARVKLGYK
ncbi:MAG TPA: hypothetical protein VK718_10940 [Ferruginibacter sp.]|jgi:hypothetical protein|nr:hypothetical protein [Ferruginibacter sp.]